MSILESILIGISIAAIPGPIFFELVRRTLTKGFLHGFLLAVGEFLGNLILLALIFFGLNSFLTNIIAKIILYLVGSAILILLGIVAFKLKKKDIERSYTKKISSKNSIFAGFGIAITSPIVIALWISVSGSYLAQIQSRALAFLNIFFIAFGLLIFYLTMSSVIDYTRHKIPAKYLLILSRIFGAILILYGASFMYSAGKMMIG